MEGKGMASHDERCASCAIRHQAICGALSDEELTALNAIAHFRKVRAGQTVMADSEPSSFFGNVLSGAVKLTKMMPDGRQQIVGLLFPSDFLGRAFSPDAPYYAEAASDVELCTFPRTEFERLLKAYPTLEHRLLEHTLDELDASREWMLLLGRKNAEEKVASFLVMIARRARNVGCAGSDNLDFARFALPLSRAETADYLGLTIETVSRQITRLRARGLISLEKGRTFVVPSIRALAQVAEPNGTRLD